MTVDASGVFQSVPEACVTTTLRRHKIIERELPNTLTATTIRHHGFEAGLAWPPRPRRLASCVGTGRASAEITASGFINNYLHLNLDLKPAPFDSRAGYVAGSADRWRSCH